MGLPRSEDAGAGVPPFTPDFPACAARSSKVRYNGRKRRSCSPVRLYMISCRDSGPYHSADSLSWSVREQKEIDRKLKRVWESTLAELPDRPPRTGGPGLYHDRMLPEDLSRLRKFGIPYVFGDPAKLYIAHPKWPKQPSDELDERTLYYCSQDIDSHLKSWEEAALERRSDYIRVRNDAELYHPQYRDRWPQPPG